VFGWGLAFSATLCLALIGVGVYGYHFYVVQAEHPAAADRAAAAQRAGEPPPAPEPAAGPPAATVTDRFRADEQQIVALRTELASAMVAAERAAREQEALRLKLENAERVRLETEATLQASRSRITALEAELGAGGSVDRLVDANGQPLGEHAAVSAGDLATLGMELRLVERERNAARVQLDRALERISALEAAQAASTAGQGTDESRQKANEAAIVARLAELEAANQDLAADKSALELALARVEADRAALSETAAATRTELEASLVAVQAAQALSDDRAGELQVALAAAEARAAELEQGLSDTRTDRDALEAERASVAARLEAATQQIAALEGQRDAAASIAEETAARLESLEAERDGLAESLAAEREVAAQATARIATLESEGGRLEQTLVAERDGLAASLEASARRCWPWPASVTP
jgi:DNA repair exonuclease SbcCD ATPase subunit